jgi:hypothetical protein
VNDGDSGLRGSCRARQAGRAASPRGRRHSVAQDANRKIDVSRLRRPR